MDERTRRFYQARQWRPAWNAASAGQLQAAIKDLGRHGIDQSRLNEALASSDDPTAREVNLTRTALTYGDILSHGLIDPAQVYEIFALDKNTYDVDGTLSASLDAKRLGDWLAALPPQDEEYQALSDAYVRYLAEAKEQQPAPIPSGKAIKPGQSDPRIPQIKAALIAAGFLYSTSTETQSPPAAPAKPETATATPAPSLAYDQSLVDAVKLFQDHQGINADGVIGAGTIAVLNAGPADRARQIALNLEERRWLARTPPATRIDVNTAAAFLTYYRNGEEADRRRTITGKKDTATPNLAGSFSNLVVNPPWNVPSGIAAKEILPKGAGYLAANDMYVEGGRVVQRAGPKSALGRVKFNMENRYAIYLHDTPSKAPFQANERHLSHGCVRVDDAIGFAHLLVNDRGKGGDLDTKLATTTTSTLQLGETIPVRIFYHTAFLDPSGVIAFRPDVYGWDEELATALGMSPPIRREIERGGAIDVGP